MIALTSFFLLLAIIVFLLAYRLNLKKRLLIALAVWFIPSIVILSLILIVRDKPSPNSYAWYSGFPHIDPASPGEQEYQKLVTAAKLHEQKGQIDDAIAKYQKALKTSRIIVPSYYVLFDIGRLQYDLKNYEQSRVTLSNFLANVDMELTYKEGKGVKEPPAGGFMVADQTNEHLASLLSDKATAEQLINTIEEAKRAKASSRPN